MRVQPNAGATSETAQTLKTIHTRHTLSHSNKANMKWLWRPDDIRGLCGLKVSWHLSYRWGKTPKNASPRKLVPTGDRTRARYVTGVHATACPTAVNPPYHNFENWRCVPHFQHGKMFTPLQSTVLNVRFCGYKDLKGFVIDFAIFVTTVYFLRLDLDIIEHQITMFILLFVKICKI